MSGNGSGHTMLVIEVEGELARGVKLAAYVRRRAALSVSFFSL